MNVGVDGDEMTTRSWIAGLQSRYRVTRCYLLSHCGSSVGLLGMITEDDDVSFVLSHYLFNRILKSYIYTILIIFLVLIESYLMLS